MLYAVAWRLAAQICRRLRVAELRVLHCCRLTWNLMGMMNNPHYRVKVHVDTNATGHMAMVFEHPTKSGSESGG